MAVQMQGTLTADGALVLDAKPALPPGRVKVNVESVPQETLVDFVARTRQEMQAAGSKFMNDEEVTAWIDELRADDDRIEEAAVHDCGREKGA